MALSHLIFDLDNTLYPPSRGVVERVDRRITAYMVERLGLSPDDAGVLRARYRDQHGTTLNGLMRHHDVAPDDYLESVHAIAVEDLLTPDPALGDMLAALPHRKVVFTNGSAAHAERVLARLDVRSHFAEVFSLERVAYVPKPDPAAFRAVLAALAVAAPVCLLVDDRRDNLTAAAGLGMRTILVDAEARGGQAERDGIDAAIGSILDLPAAVARLDA